MSKKYTMWGFMPGWEVKSTDEQKADWEDFKSKMETLYDQITDLKKTVRDAKREQWNIMFSKYMEMYDTVASAMPDEEDMPSVQGVPTPVSPKKRAKKMKEFIESANKTAMEQEATAFEFMKDRQEKVKDMAKEAVEKVEEELDNVKNED